MSGRSRIFCMCLHGRHVEPWQHTSNPRVGMFSGRYIWSSERRGNVEISHRSEFKQRPQMSELLASSSSIFVSFRSTAGSIISIATPQSLYRVFGKTQTSHSTMAVFINIIAVITHVVAAFIFGFFLICFYKKSTVYL